MREIIPLQKQNAGQKPNKMIMSSSILVGHIQTGYRCELEETYEAEGSVWKFIRHQETLQQQPLRRDFFLFYFVNLSQQ